MGVKEISPLKQPPLPPTGKGADLNSGFTSMKKKKRGAGKSAQRANAWRNAKHRYGLQQQHHRKQRGMSKLSYTETVEIIDKRQRKFEEPSQKEVDDMIVGGIGENFKTLEIMFLHMKSLVLSIVRLWVKFQRKKMTASPCSGGSKLTFFICGPARTRAVKYVRY